MSVTDMRNKPPTQQTTPLRQWIRANFLSGPIKKIPKNEKTLDMGCGYGFSFMVNPKFYGVEVDEGGFAHCRKLGYRVRQCSLLAPLPFESGFFDNCFTHDVLEHFHLEDVPAIFKHAHKVLKPDGRFINIIPNRLGYDQGLRAGAGHLHFITPEEVGQIAERTGFDVMRVYSSPLPSIFHNWVVHNKYIVETKKKGI